MKNILYIPAVLSIIILSACKNQQAESCFDYSPLIITTTVPVTFNASCTKNNIGNYKWNFGDGSPEIAVSSETITHTYSSTGSYTVYLTAVGEGNWRNKGITNAIQKTITVQ